MRAIEITAKDGAVIPAITLGIDDSKKKAVIIISHGFGEHSGSYIELAEQFQKAGYASIIPDQRGHGKPPEGVKKWHGIIPDYQCFIEDIISLTDYAGKVAPGTPIAVYGHSMGGNIVINTVLQSSAQKVSPYFCAVLESPWLDLYKPLSILEKCIVNLLSRILPDLRQNRKLNHSDLSGDAERSDGYSKDPLYHGFISMRMASGVFSGCNYAMENAHNFSIPAYLAYAENDVVICNKAIHDFAEKAGDAISIKGYQSNHAIHNDENRELFLTDVIAFLDSCLPFI